MEQKSIPLDPSEREALAEEIRKRFTKDIQELYASAQYEHSIVGVRITEAEQNKKLFTFLIYDGSMCSVHEQLFVYDIESAGSIPIIVTWEPWEPFIASCQKA